MSRASRRPCVRRRRAPTLAEPLESRRMLDATLTTVATFSSSLLGSKPYAGVIFDAAGNLYGTTSDGGMNNEGTVFEVLAVVHTLTTLVTFDDTNGDRPIGGLVADAAGNLYGTTSDGGANSDGTVFEVSASNHTLTTLASFDGIRGANPYAGLTVDASGNLYGTTFNGGANDDGTVFEVSAARHTLTTLASFNGTNGMHPRGGLVVDAAGNLFGTANGGGASNDGTVFEVSAADHAITALASFGSPNGVTPGAGLVADAAGNVYGTTTKGGANDDGTVFEVSAAGHTLTTLASFDATDGIDPEAGLIADASGNLYGTTNNGGANGAGTVFQFSAAGHTLTTLASFVDTNGVNPQAGLVADPTGNLYGTTYGGGENSDGTVFEVTGSGFDASSSTFASVHVYDDPAQAGSNATPVAGRQVFVDANGDGVFEAGETTATTAADGCATLAVPPNQASRIGEVLPDGVSQVGPATAEATVQGTGSPAVNFFTKALSATPVASSTFYSNYTLGSLPSGYETDAAATQPDGKRLVAGTDRSGATPQPFVARFLPDGEPDGSFAGGGVARGPAGTVAVSVVEEPDGTVYLASKGATPGTSYVSGFTAAGAAGPAAYATTASAATAGTAVAAGLALAVDGSLLFTGTVKAAGATAPVSFVTDLVAATLQPAAPFAAAGTVLGTATLSSLVSPARVTPAGGFDLLVNPAAGGGLVLDAYSAAGALTGTTAFANDLPAGTVPKVAVVESNGQTVVAGVGPAAEGGNLSLTVARFNVDGSADGTFGSAGLATEDEAGTLAAAGTLVVCDVAVLPDGTTLVTGKYDDAAASDYEDYCQEYTAAGAELLGYGASNRLVVSATTAVGVVGLAGATGVLPTVSTAATPAAGDAAPAFIDGGVGFNVNVTPVPAMLTGGSLADLNVETARPAAVWQVPAAAPVTVSGSTVPVRVQVEFKDPIAVSLRSLHTGNLRVTLPDGTTGLPTFVGVESTGDVRDLYADYVVPPVGGTWDATDDGTYTLSLVAGQVRNTARSADPVAALGTFAVAVVPAQPSPTGSAAATVVVSSAAATVQGGNFVTLTATVSPAAGAVVPTGTVTFLDGTAAIGSAPLSGGVAVYSTAALAAGSHSVTATYAGDATYAPTAASAATPATLTVTAPASTDPALSVTLAAAKLPPAAIAGAKRRLTVPVTIVNVGGSIERGTVTIALYASTSPTLDASAVAVTAAVRRVLTLKPGAKRTIAINLTGLPATLGDGAYRLLAQVVDAAGFGRTAATAAAVRVSPPTVTPTLTFTRLLGTASFTPGQRPRSTAVLTLSNGGNVPLVGPVTITLALTTGGTVTDPSADLVTATRHVSVPAGRNATIAVPLGLIPSSIAAGTYTLAATVMTPAVNGAPAASATADEAVAVTVA